LLAGQVALPGRFSLFLAFLRRDGTVSCSCCVHRRRLFQPLALSRDQQQMVAALATATRG